MSGQTPMPDAQIAACRAEMQAMASLWSAVAHRSQPKARHEAEVQVFNQMAVALAARLGAEGARHRPLAELHLLAQGIARNRGRFPASSDWRAEHSVTGHHPGDPIRLTSALFSRLVEACLATLTAPQPA